MRHGERTKHWGAQQWEVTLSCLESKEQRPWELKYTAGKETRDAKRAEKKMAQDLREAAGGAKTCRWRDGWEK